MRDQNKQPRESGIESTSRHWSTLRTLFVELLANRVVQA